MGRTAAIVLVHRTRRPRAEELRDRAPACEAPVPPAPAAAPVARDRVVDLFRAAAPTCCPPRRDPAGRRLQVGLSSPCTHRWPGDVVPRWWRPVVVVNASAMNFYLWHTAAGDGRGCRPRARRRVAGSSVRSPPVQWSRPVRADRGAWSRLSSACSRGVRGGSSATTDCQASGADHPSCSSAPTSFAPERGRPSKSVVDEVEPCPPPCRSRGCSPPVSRPARCRSGRRRPWCPPCCWRASRRRAP